jgi:glutathione synthase/RimK-type ligase-like ATP-grasp enzyme
VDDDMNQKILVTATFRYDLAARLAIAFAKVGCTVDAHCPHEHPLEKVRVVERVFAHRPLRARSTLRAAIGKSVPDLVIPCDDPAAFNLQHLYEDSDSDSAADRLQRQLIERSLGRVNACLDAASRMTIMTMAAEMGIRVPPGAPINGPDELQRGLEAVGFPAAIKIDGTSGGTGVAIVTNELDAKRAYRAATVRPAVGKAALQTMLHRDESFLRRALQRRRSPVSLQAFIDGKPANRAVACWRGRVLAGVSVEAICTQHASGPATVVRLIDNAEMAQAAAQLVRRLECSGLWGFDFILESDTADAYLIEVNPRATPMSAVALANEYPLPAALCSRLRDEPLRAVNVAPNHPLIAMFPYEWRRDPASPYLRSAFHDVPWEEPALVRECMEIPWSERGVVARITKRVRAALKSTAAQAPAGTQPPTALPPRPIVRNYVPPS